MFALPAISVLNGMYRAYNIPLDKYFFKHYILCTIPSM